LYTMKDKTILVTGGTGSFGQEFVKQALELKPRSIRIYSRGEELQQRMEREFNDSRLRFMIGDVRDKDRLMAVTRNCDIIVHAAALKQVPTAEYNPTEVIKTNIDGSSNIVDVAIERGIEKVLGVSSDKAVSPINIYGATKLVMERLFLQANQYTQTKFSIIRLGNIWGSRGSVIPIWEEQAKTGTIKITEADMIRFWISQEEAVKFGIKCLEKMQGNEIFIPYMKEEKMLNLAWQLYPDCKVEIIGRRPGEKLKEVLFNEGEKPEVIDGHYVVRT
jgi:UDP-N-acetylglucosamine 4,6-dehydratase